MGCVRTRALGPLVSRCPTLEVHRTPVYLMVMTPEREFVRDKFVPFVVRRQFVWGGTNEGAVHVGQIIAFDGDFTIINGVKQHRPAFRGAVRVGWAEPCSRPTSWERILGDPTL